ncbi:hypothetical protein Naga_100031g14 [Nannochloropsis gaditana]|uniref:Uncharacterized protein n=1 Tax=Nannochloropsis gaditana TaxID=72520 RepID=W7TJU5_9STRA|nr:hypothetical protein Naga_100031g14 [Nannochloropsis gaditana]
MLTPQGNRFLTELPRPQLGIISRHDCQPSTLPHVRVSIPLRGVPARGVVTCLGEWRRPHQDLGVCVITGMRGQHCRLVATHFHPSNMLLRRCRRPYL